MILLTKEVFVFTQNYEESTYNVEVTLSPTEKAMVLPEPNQILYQYRICVKKTRVNDRPYVQRGIMWLSGHDISDLNTDRCKWFSENILTAEIIQRFDD